MKLIHTLAVTTALAAVFAAAPACAQTRIALVVKSLGNGFFEAAASWAARVRSCRSSSAAC